MKIWLIILTSVAQGQSTASSTSGDTAASNTSAIVMGVAATAILIGLMFLVLYFLKRYNRMLISDRLTRSANSLEGSHHSRDESSGAEQHETRHRKSKRPDGTASTEELNVEAKEDVAKTSNLSMAGAPSYSYKAADRTRRSREPTRTENSTMSSSNNPSRIAHAIHDHSEISGIPPLPNDVQTGFARSYSNMSIAKVDVQLSNNGTQRSISFNKIALKFLPQKSNSTTTMHDGTTLCFGEVQEIAVPGFLEVRHGTDYRIGKRIAKGGGAVIYRVEIVNTDLKMRCLNEEVVAKLFPGELTESREKSLYQEVAIMWYLRDSSYISKIIGFAVQPPAILMRYYPLGSLRNYIDRTPREQYTRTQIMRMLRLMTLSVQNMHVLGLVHADIKPDNILIDWNSATREMVPVLSDFGITQIIDERILLVREFQLANIKGASIPYAAPEVLIQFMLSRTKSSVSNNTSITEDKRPDGEGLALLHRKLCARDVYGMGMVMYEMMHRIHVWKVEMTAYLKDQK